MPNLSVFHQRMRQAVAGGDGLVETESHAQSGTITQDNSTASSATATIQTEMQLTEAQKKGFERHKEFHEHLLEPKNSNFQPNYQDVKTALNLIILLTISDPGNAESPMPRGIALPSWVEGMEAMGLNPGSNLKNYGENLKSNLQAYINKYGLDSLDLSPAQKTEIEALMGLANPTPSVGARAVNILQEILFLPVSAVGAFFSTVRETFSNLWTAVTTADDPKDPWGNKGKAFRESASPYGMRVFNTFPRLQRSIPGRIFGGLLSLVFLPVDLAVGMVFKTFKGVLTAAGMSPKTFNTLERGAHALTSAAWVAFLAVISAGGVVPAVVAFIPNMGAILSGIGTAFSAIGSGLGSLGMASTWVAMGNAIASVGPAIVNGLGTALSSTTSFFSGLAASFSASPVVAYMTGSVAGALIGSALGTVGLALTGGIMAGAWQLGSKIKQAYKSFMAPKPSQAALNHNVSLDNKTVGGKNTIEMPAAGTRNKQITPSKTPPVVPTKPDNIKGKVTENLTSKVEETKTKKASSTNNSSTNNIDMNSW